MDRSRYDALMVDPAQFRTEAQIDEWVASSRHKVMYRDENNVD